MGAGFEQWLAGAAYRGARGQQPCDEDDEADVHAIPILPTVDLAGSRAFYVSAGLQVEAYDDGYAFVLHDGHEVLHLAVVPELDPAANHAACYLHVRQVDEVRDRLRSAGLAVTAVRDEPWGMREFSVVDPSGNRLRVGCAADEDEGDDGGGRGPVHGVADPGR